MSQISRRDFLRTAGKDAAKEAIETGAKILPGGQIAKRFIEGGKADEGAEGAEGAGFVEEPKQNWWDRIVMRKREGGK
jgi:hypothetical protein